MNEVNQIDVSQCDDEFEVNKAHIQNPNYKGKNYDLNYQNRNNNNSSNGSSNTATGYNKYNNTGSSSNHTKINFQDKPNNVQVILTGPVNKEQLFKIQEVLRHPSQYREKLPLDARPATGEYAKSFNKFIPKKVEVNEATVDEVVNFGCFIKKSDAEVTEAIDLHKALGDDVHYGPEDKPNDPQQQD